MESAIRLRRIVLTKKVTNPPRRTRLGSFCLIPFYIFNGIGDLAFGGLLKNPNFLFRKFASNFLILKESANLAVGGFTKLPHLLYFFYGIGDPLSRIARDCILVNFQRIVSRFEHWKFSSSLCYLIYIKEEKRCFLYAKISYVVEGLIKGLNLGDL